MDDTDGGRFDPFGSDDALTAGGDEGSGDDVVAAPQGFGERLANSVGAILVGLILVPLACAGLFWNEYHAVRVERALDETGAVVQSIGSERRDPSLDGRVVHVAGETTSAQGVTDEAMGVRAKGLKLARTVSMYQWHEKESGSGNDRTFRYARDWSSHPIASSGFHQQSGHQNPPFPSYRDREIGAADAVVGAVPVGAQAVLRLGGAQTLTVDEAGLATARKTAGRPTQVSDGAYYVGQDPQAPRVGDVRITYALVREGPASFIGRQEPGGLEPYRARNGEEVLLGYAGTWSAAEVVRKGQHDNAVLAWVLRAVGMVVLLIGFALLFAPVNLLASYVPILGSLVSGATFLVALGATLVVGPTVIAIAWFAVRPLLSVALIAGALVAVLGLRRLRARRRAAPAGAVPA